MINLLFLLIYDFIYLFIFCIKCLIFVINIILTIQQVNPREEKQVDAGKGDSLLKSIDEFLVDESIQKNNTDVEKPFASQFIFNSVRFNFYKFMNLSFFTKFFLKGGVPPPQLDFLEGLRTTVVNFMALVLDEGHKILNVRNGLILYIVLAIVPSCLCSV